MEENYADAALRHWHDAELLNAESRIENADQLYGLSAECAIKSALVSLPAFSTNTILNDSYREHINVLWNRVNHQSLQRTYPNLLNLLDKSNPFEDWHVRQRYCRDSDINPQTVATHRITTRRLLGAVGLTGVRK